MKCNPAAEKDLASPERPQVSHFRDQGYLIVDKPIFPQSEFDALCEHFERKVAALPPDVRPEAMDVPHFQDAALFRWLLSDHVLDLVEPIIGPNIALFSSHFICKPKGNGKRVPWHEDSAYWKDHDPPHGSRNRLAGDRSLDNGQWLHVCHSPHPRRTKERFLGL